MKKETIRIEGIPAIVWGEASDTLFVAVHGYMSCKDDAVIAIFAEEAAARGFGALSFDLPEHGERKGGGPACTPSHCVRDLAAVFAYARTRARRIGLFGCSMGAYFGLVAGKDLPLEKCLFLSPVLDMCRLIGDMMRAAGVDADRLRAERKIQTAAGPTLDWDDYAYVRDHPVAAWNKPTCILCGEKDDVVPAAMGRRVCRKNVRPDRGHGRRRAFLPHGSGAGVLPAMVAGDSTTFRPCQLKTMPPSMISAWPVM